MSDQGSSINALYNLNGIPIFTYGMIGITIFGLACVTMLDDSNTSYAKDEGYAASLNDTTQSVTSAFSSMLGTPTEEKTQEEPEPSEESEEIKLEETEEKQPEAEAEKTEQTDQEEQPLEQEEQSPLRGGIKKHRKTKSNINKYQHNKTKGKRNR